MKEVIIACDAGGTKTKVAIVTKDFQILEAIDAGIGSMAVSIKAYDNIRNGVIEVCNKAIKQYKIVCIYLGITAFAIFDQAKNLEEELKKMYKTHVVVTKDTNLALNLILKDQHQDGVVAISGTGASVYGTNQGVEYMTSGWGQLLTERGSGYACVKDFVVKIIQTSESCEALTPLQLSFLSYINWNNDLRTLSLYMYNQPKSQIAKDAKFFIDKANELNLEAINHLKMCGKVLAIDAINCIKHLNYDQKIPIGVVGGFINHSKISKQAFFETIEEAKINYYKVDETMDPIYGAVYYTLRNKLFGE